MCLNISNRQNIGNISTDKKVEKTIISETNEKIKPDIKSLKQIDNLKSDNSLLGKVKNKINPVIDFVGNLENKAIEETEKLNNKIKILGNKTLNHIEDAVHPLRLWKNDSLPVPPDKGGLKMTSYNIYLGGKRINEIEKYLMKENPDIVCLQEASAESAQRLGKKLGMHVAFYQMERGYDRNTGKAILSKYPINDVKNINYENSWSDKAKAFTKEAKNHHFSGESLESRSMLKTKIQVGNKEIEIIDTHLSLSDPVANAKQINQLADYINQEKAKGKIVMAAGDFNTNMALAGNGKSDPIGKLITTTDTVSEFKERYKRSPGNIEDPKVKNSADKLDSSAQSAWKKAEKRVVILDGKEISPEQAKKEIDSNKLSKDSSRYKALMQVIDGITHLGAEKRFDNIFTTDNIKIKKAEIDQTTTGSDHQPISVNVSWK